MRIATAAAIIAVIAPAAYAQAPAAPPPVPEVMPFDIPYGQPIGLDLANKAIAAAAAEAKKHNWKMSISVTGPAGYLVAHETMDGTQYASVELSQAKARTAALFRRQTSVFQNGVNSGGTPAALSLMANTGGVASEGGFPIVVDGKLIGAIGASGGISSQDAVTAKAGLDAITVK
nr:heme-binding protein [uncultured Rhodopila sp.]